jgi:hypothetical protein
MSRCPPNRSQLRIPEVMPAKRSNEMSILVQIYFDNNTLPPWHIRDLSFAVMREGGLPVDHFSLPVKLSPHACTEQTDVLNFRPDIQSSLRWVSVVEAPARFPIQYIAENGQTT